MWGHTLQRSPLQPAVPLEGSDTVQGLSTLARLRAANLLPPAGGAPRGGAAAAAAAGGRRRRYQRFRGPFVEQATLDDLRAAPRPWTQFWGSADAGGGLGGAYNVPASADALAERVDENLAAFLPNYLRLAAALVLAAFYLRPRALLGAAALGAAAWLGGGRALEAQQREAGAAAAAARAGRPAPAREPTGALAALGMLATWILVARTGCMPILLLGALAAAAACAAHAAARRAPSELRHRGRAPLGWPFRAVVGAGPPPPAGGDPRLLFRELWHGARGAAAVRAASAGRWARYYAMLARDTVRRAPGGPGQSGWS
jgi:hypothetical protein